MFQLTPMKPENQIHPTFGAPPLALGACPSERHQYATSTAAGHCASPSRLSLATRRSAPRLLENQPNSLELRFVWSEPQKPPLVAPRIIHKCIEILMHEMRASKKRRLDFNNVRPSSLEAIAIWIVTPQCELLDSTTESPRGYGDEAKNQGWRLFPRRASLRMAPTGSKQLTPHF